ncbi:MAG: hypothetical protein LBD37_08695 [Treponema sp.]|nr:hypothetical protein [Treponema sp.]
MGIMGLGGAVFLLGWAHLKVPPGSYGVVRSKLFGVEKAVIREGKFRWLWYKLIPTNVAITVFTPSLVVRPIRVTGVLPSGEAYQLFAGLAGDFSYTLTGSCSWSIRADALPSLMERRGVTTQEALHAYEDRLAGEIDAFIARQFSLDAADRLAAAPQDGLAEALQREIQNAFGDIEQVQLELAVDRYPDISRYHAVQKLYDEYIAQQRRLLETEITAAAKTRLGTQLRLDELARYGELLTKYPILLQYLSLEKGSAGLMPDAPEPAEGPR